MFNEMFTILVIDVCEYFMLPKEKTLKEQLIVFYLLQAIS